MPVPWLAVAGAYAALHSGKIVVQNLDDDVVVTARENFWDVPHQIHSFRDGVRIDYGPTVVTADQVDAHMAPNEEYLEARGNVVLNDPMGLVRAQNLKIVWREGARGGTADNLEGMIAGTHIWASHAEILPQHWTFLNARFTTCGENPPWFLVSSPRVEFIPGKHGRAVHPHLYVLGHSLVTLPNQNFNLDPRTVGLRIPSISYHKDDGLGVSWISGVLLNEQTSLFANVAAYPRSLPGYGLVVSRSFVQADVSRTLLRPRSDLSERFDYGYFDDVEVSQPTDEQHYITTPRSTLAAGADFNQGVNGRGASYDRYSEVQAAFEKNGKVDSLPFVGQIRLESIRNQFTPYYGRAVVTATAGPPVMSVGRHLDALLRFDTSAYVGSTTFGWGRLTGGVFYTPFPQLRLGVAGVTSLEGGEPQLPIDPLISRGGVDFRADLNLGATQVSYIKKYDPGLKWYDREYSIRQAIGCLEGFVMYRQNPEDYRFGVTFRVDQFVDLLQRRRFERTQPAKRTVISGPSDMPDMPGMSGAPANDPGRP